MPTKVAMAQRMQFVVGMGKLSNVLIGLATAGFVGYMVHMAYGMVRDMPSGSSSRPDFKMPEAKASGELAVTSSEVGNFTAAFASCRSGEHHGFYGVDLLDQNQRPALRIVRDPIKGFAVLVRAPDSDKAGTLTPETCANLRADVRRTNTTINTVRALDGDATLDCDLPGGGHVTLRATFTMCH